MDDTTQPTGQEEILDTDQDLNNQDPVAEPQKKSKEENFDGVVRKLNAREKEIKKANSLIEELQKQIEGKKEEATNSEKNELAELKKAIEELKNERSQEAFQSKIEKGLDLANIEPKFNKLAKTALQDIATENSLDLTDKAELQEAITLLTTDYPEFLSKKPKSIGIVNGQTPSNSTGLTALEGNAEGYFKLSDSEKKALIKKVFQKK